MPSVIEVPSDFSSPVVKYGVHRGAVGVGDGDLDVLVALLQRHRDAAQRAAGADRADEAVDLAVGLLPDLRAGGAVVALAVGDVVELVGPDHAVRVARPSAPRPSGRRPSRSCWGPCRARPALPSARRRRGAACPSSPGTGCPGSRSGSCSRARCRPAPGRCRCCRRCPRRSGRPCGVSPFCSASSMMASAARSLTEPPGFRNSALPRMVQPVSSEAFLSLMSGVLPIAPMKPSRISMRTPWVIGQGSRG